MKITFNMATIPSRYKIALKAIDSVYDQADEIRVYLNNFEQVPEELNRDKIITHIGEDLNATGKLFWALNPDEYYFCIDDDLRYPPTYAQDMIPYLNALKDKACVSLHGKILNPTPLQSYFKGVKYAFHCLLGFDITAQVHVIGNGVSAFNTNKVKIDYTKFKYYHMDDIEVSLQLQKQNIPAVVIAHNSNYLGSVDPEEIEGVKTLHTQYHENDSTHTERINSIKWTFHKTDIS